MIGRGERRAGQADFRLHHWATHRLARNEYRFTSRRLKRAFRVRPEPYPSDFADRGYRTPRRRFSPPRRSWGRSGPESAAAMDFAFVPLDHQQLLVPLADRDHELASLGQLVDERLGTWPAAHGDDDHVERLFLPAAIAVAVPDGDVFVAEAGEAFLAWLAKGSMISML